MGNIKNTADALSELEIDEKVEAQADDDSAWEEWHEVKRSNLTALSLPADLAARASFFAHLHGAERVEEWLLHVILQRIRFEEAAFAELKRDLIGKGNQ